MKAYKDIIIVVTVISLMISSTAAWYYGGLTYEGPNPYAINFVDTGFVVVQSSWVYSGTSKVILTLELVNNSTEPESADIEIMPLDSDGNVLLDGGVNMTQYANTGLVAPGDSWMQEFLFQKSGIRLELNVFQIIITGEDTFVQGDRLSTYNIEQTIYTSGGGTTLPLRIMTGYMSGTVDRQKYPKYRYNDGNWSDEIELINAASDKVREVRLEFNPHPSYNDRAVLVVLTDDGYLQAYTYNGFAWSTPFTLGRLWLSAPSVPTRPFDIAYEKTSGNLMVLYSNELNNNGYQELAYRFFDGASWSQEYYLDDPKTIYPAGGVSYRWIRLATDYTSGSDKIGFVGWENGWWKYSIAIWDGSNWVDWQQIDQGPWHDDGESMDVAWEYTSGRCMVTVSEGVNIGYYIWDGSWSSRATFHLADDGWNGWTWLSLKPHNVAGSDRMMLIGLDLNGEYASAIDWTGTSWNGEGTILDNRLESSWGRCIDGDWEPTGTKFLVAAGDRNENAISYKTWTPGGGWSHSTGNWATYNSGYGSDQVWIEVTSNPTGDDPLMSVGWIDDKDNFVMAEWNGATMTNGYEVTKKSRTEYMGFDISFSWR